MAEGDFLDELIAERTARNAGFRVLVEAAGERRRMLRELAQERSRLELTQTEIAAVMGTSQSSVARIEAGRADVKLSTLERYAATLGRRIEWKLLPDNDRSRRSRKGRGSAKARR